MNAIHYLKGDATAPQAKGTKIICLICNDLGGWGRGFVLAISKRWPEPETDYRKWHRERSSNDFGLGEVRYIQAEQYIYVANMIAQKGIKTGSKGPPVRYEAVETCLREVAAKAKKLGASVHMPRIGCGLAGGSWDKIEPILIKQLIANNIETYVYDF